MLKGDLKKLNAMHYSHISASAERASKALKDAQLHLSSHPDIAALNEALLGLRKEARLLANAEQLFISQKVKCSYLKESDRCSKFFHSMVKRKAKRNHIASIYKEDGTPTCSVQEVEEEFTRYFQGLLGSSSTCQPIVSKVLRSGRCISIDQASGLTYQVSPDEIKAALFSIGVDKSPGPDGFSSAFFKKSWNIIGDDFCNAV